MKLFFSETFLTDFVEKTDCVFASSPSYKLPQTDDKTYSFCSLFPEKHENNHETKANDLKKEKK